MNQYEICLDRLSQYFTDPKVFGEHVDDSKREFFERSGLPDENEEQFELIMSQFLDWYLFSKKLPNLEISPVESVLEPESQFPMKEDERKFFQNLAQATHSLFEFVKSRGEELTVKDLLKNEKLSIREAQVLLNYNRDEIFEARLIPHEGNFLFTKGFCFHPQEARRYILREIKKFKSATLKEQETLMFRLMKMRLKYDKYSHIKIQEIYTNESKMRF